MRNRVGAGNEGQGQKRQRNRSEIDVGVGYVEGTVVSTPVSKTYSHTQTRRKRTLIAWRRKAKCTSRR